MKYIYLLYILSHCSIIIGQETEVFYSMEYVNTFGNRILKVWITDKYIFAAKVKGLTSMGPAKGTSDKLVIPKDKRHDPKEYALLNEESKYTTINFNNIAPERFININPDNFVIARNKITTIEFINKKKWGMGNYPHNGRIKISSAKDEFNSKRKREFILIGDQDEEKILNSLKKYF